MTLKIKTWIYAQIYQIMSNSTAFDGCQTHYLVWISIQRYVISSWNMSYCLGLSDLYMYPNHVGFSQQKTSGNSYISYPIMTICTSPTSMPGCIKTVQVDQIWPFWGICTVFALIWEAIVDTLFADVKNCPKIALWQISS